MHSTAVQSFESSPKYGFRALQRRVLLLFLETIEIKLALSLNLKERRQRLMTQAELAEKINSSQPPIAKAENGEDSVSIELLIRAILATGATPQYLG